MRQRPLLLISGSVLLFLVSIINYRVHFDREGSLRNLGYETTSIATSLLDHHEFANPFRTPTGPTAFLAPVYPTFIAVLMSLFGTGSWGVFALQWSVTILIALQMALWPWVAERLQIGYVSGFVAAVIWLLCDIPRSDVWEAHLAGLLFVLLGLAMVRMTEAPSLRRSILVGLFWGATLLCSPVALLVLVPWAIWILVTRKLQRTFVVAMLLSCGIVVVPWLLRNFVVLHHVIYVRDNLGLELDVANRDCATYLFEWNVYSGCFSSTHPNDSAPEVTAVRELGEIEYDRRRMISARQWIRSNPGRFLKLCGQRATAFWIPSAMHYPWSPNPPRRRWIVTSMTILGIGGLVLMRRRSPEFAMVCLLWLAGYPFIYYLVQYSERFRTPLLWASFLPAAYLIVQGVGRIGERLRHNSHSNQ